MCAKSIKLTETQEVSTRVGCVCVYVCVHVFICVTEPERERGVSKQQDWRCGVIKIDERLR